MTIKHPPDVHVYAALLEILRRHGVRYASFLVDCRLAPAISFPTYVVTAAGEARAMLAAVLERALGREFAQGDGRWVLEAEEARMLAYGAVA
jgi:hypothetical protein